ncbi:hypothetical protein [Vibrio caribbeanicus]|uniref:NADH dehydrogenase subunit II-related protein n=1 Tax=Vibrio caribbeanicus ATCC BAA-2122 TaxID=796620 RepID=E3BH54_9VIBR|nr:hypothetical protein [Vibrio caribbeanicus]EFP97577.1 NADH dehydrogenase subunit II-related protein [Vibrio caribbeanicus ATCC BAA-2122]
MLSRYKEISPNHQFYLFTLGLVLCLLAMVLTDMWLPIVAGTYIMTGLVVEAWVRLVHILPLQDDMARIQQELTRLNEQLDKLQEVEQSSAPHS